MELEIIICGFLHKLGEILAETLVNVIGGIL